MAALYIFVVVEGTPDYINLSHNNDPINICVHQIKYKLFAENIDSKNSICESNGGWIPVLWSNGPICFDCQQESSSSQNRRDFECVDENRLSLEMLVLNLTVFQFLRTGSETCMKM